MKLARLLPLLLILSLLPGNQPPTSAAVAPPAALQPVASKLDPTLQAELAANPARLEYLVVLTEQADTSNNISPLHWAEKGWYVYNQLRATATHSQAPLLTQLNTMRDSGMAHLVRSFYIMNAVLVEGTPQSLYQLAARSDVAAVRSTAPQQVAVPTTSEIQSAATPLITEPNLQMMHAPEVWASGNLGQGTVVSVNDTGTIYTHTALLPHWRGTTILPGADYNWHDAVNNQPLPYDDGNGPTGTGLTSIMVGDDGRANRVGVAPGATWISCKMLRGDDFTTTMPIILDCLEWQLAPTDLQGQNPRPDLRPHVVVNGWSWFDGDICTLDFQPAIQAWVNAGIYPVWHVGDYGYAEPGLNRSPNNYPEVRTTGGLKPNGTLVFSSSTGPSNCDPNTLMPTMLAPGEARTARRNNSYGLFTGTIPAAAHQAGAVALLRYRNPSLTITETTYYLTSTAVFTPSWAGGQPPLGGPRPNNKYGWGLINVAAAVAAVPPYGSTPTATSTPIPASNTPLPTLTATAPPTSTPPQAPTLTPTLTAAPASPTLPTTPSATATEPQRSTPTPTACPNRFVDIGESNPLFRYVLALSCAGVINGVDPTHFGPGQPASRGQFAKMLALGLALPLATPATPSFTDVPTTYFAYPYIEALRARPGVLDGYSAGQCAAAGATAPCFLPNRFVSRAEAVKSIVKARGWVFFTPPAGYGFADVRPDHWAYIYVETAYYHEVIGGAGGYFQPARDIRRDEIAKVVFLGVNNN